MKKTTELLRKIKLSRMSPAHIYLAGIVSLLEIRYSVNRPKSKLYCINDEILFEQLGVDDGYLFVHPKIWDDLFYNKTSWDDDYESNYALFIRPNTKILREFVYNVFKTYYDINGYEVGGASQFVVENTWLKSKLKK